MKTRTIFALIIAGIFLLFSSSCFATNNMMNDAGNGMRNMVGGAGNMVQDAANGAGNMVKGAIGGIGEGISNMGEGMQNMTRDGMTNDTNDSNEENTSNVGDENTARGDYNATRTATTADTENGTFLGMNATTWTWVIMGIAGAAIVGTVWFYGKQHEDGYKPNHDDNY